MNKVCNWDNSAATLLVHNKKAVGAALFISFLGYTAAVILSELKRNTRVTRSQSFRYSSPRISGASLTTWRLASSSTSWRHCAFTA